MSEESDRGYNVEGDTVEGPVDCIGRDEVIQALNKLKSGINHGLSDVSFEMIAVSGH